MLSSFSLKHSEHVSSQGGAVDANLNFQHHNTTITNTLKNWSMHSSLADWITVMLFLLDLPKPQQVDPS